jgi:DNA-binding IclR family transcriptional regulator
MRQTNAPMVKSAARALAVLEFFDDVRQPSTATAICEALALPISSASMLLRSLVSLGYLSHDIRDRTYMATLRVASLGDWLHDQTSTRPLFEMTQKLSRETGQLVAVAARNGLQTQYIHVVPYRDPVPHVVRSGDRFPLVRCTSGWALISRCRDDEITRIVTRTNAEVLAEPVSPRWILEQVGQVRRTGHAFSFGQVNPDAGAVSIPLPRNAGASLALVVGGTGRRFIERADEYADMMQQTIVETFGRAAAGA